MRTAIPFLLISLVLLCAGSHASGAGAASPSSLNNLSKIIASQKTPQNPWLSANHALEDEDNLFLGVEDDDEEHEEGRDKLTDSHKILTSLLYLSCSYARTFEDRFGCVRQLPSTDSSLYLVQRALRI